MEHKSVSFFTRGRTFFLSAKRRRLIYGRRFLIRPYLDCHPPRPSINGQRERERGERERGERERERERGRDAV